MSIGIPQLETKTNATYLRGNLKAVVDTIKSIQSAIEVAKTRSSPETLAVLQSNMKASMEWGKNIQERIKFHESRFTPNA